MSAGVWSGAHTTVLRAAGQQLWHARLAAGQLHSHAGVDCRVRASENRARAILRRPPPVANMLAIPLVWSTELSSACLQRGAGAGEDTRVGQLVDAATAQALAARIACWMRARGWMDAHLTCATVAAGKALHSSTAAPDTTGALMLVPEKGS